jgi:hypothetical protein
VPRPFSDLIEQARLAGRALVEYGEGLITPTVRLGITGLSRAGKTVFITALVHSLVRNGRYPVFEALCEGRIARARLSPQPDDAVPRFDYEQHIEALAADRVWPESTRQISELRLLIEFQSRAGAMGELVLDMVDYPGEWLLDLPLLGKELRDVVGGKSRVVAQGAAGETGRAVARPPRRARSDGPGRRERGHRGGPSFRTVSFPQYGCRVDEDVAILIPHSPRMCRFPASGSSCAHKGQDGERRRLREEERDRGAFLRATKASAC